MEENWFTLRNFIWTPLDFGVEPTVCQWSCEAAVALAMSCLLPSMDYVQGIYMQYPPPTAFAWKNDAIVIRTCYSLSFYSFLWKVFQNCKLAVNHPHLYLSGRDCSVSNQQLQWHSNALQGNCRWAMGTAFPKIECLNKILILYKSKSNARNTS